MSHSLQIGQLEGLLGFGMFRRLFVSYDRLELKRKKWRHCSSVFKVNNTKQTQQHLQGANTPSFEGRNPLEILIICWGCILTSY